MDNNTPGEAGSNQSSQSSQSSPSFNILSVCSGVGMLDLGVSLAVPDSRTVAFIEIEAYCCEQLATRMEAGSLDSAPIFSDLKVFDGKPWRGRVDCIIGGYPCQPFSVAGSRLGESDPRHLFPHIARLISEIEPEWCFFENVGGHLNLGFHQVARDLQAMGYNVAARLFTAEEVGAAHKRERLFIMAHKPGNGRDERWAESAWVEGGFDAPECGGAMDTRVRSKLSETTSEGISQSVLDSHDSTRDCQWNHVEDAEQRHAMDDPDGSDRRQNSLARDSRSERLNAGREADCGAGVSDEVLGDSECSRWTATGSGRTLDAGRESEQGRGELEHSPSARLSGREDAGAGSGDAGENRHRSAESGRRCHDLGNSDLPRLEGRLLEGRGLSDERATGPTGDSTGRYSDLPLFAPGPGAIELWQELLVRFPELRPAISQEEVECTFLSLADELAPLLAIPRTDGLRAVGNGVVPIQVAYAFTILAIELLEYEAGLEFSAESQ